MKITHRVIGDCCIWEGISLMKLCGELLAMTCILRIFDSHIFTRSSPFGLLNLFVQFPSRLLAGNNCIHGLIHVLYCYQYYAGMPDLFLQFQMSQFFVEILSFGFSLANSDFDAYLAADQNLATLKCLQILFFSLILTALAWSEPCFSSQLQNSNLLSGL